MLRGLFSRSGEAVGKRRRIMLTVDVEAFQFRSPTAPLDRLIWGRFPEGDFGLERLMTIAESHGLRLPMFVDYPQYYVYGDAFLDVGREIVRRGHPLEVHLHLDYVPKDFYAKRGISDHVELNNLSDAAADALLDDVLELHGRVSSNTPVALRGGAYRYCAALLRAQSKAGIQVATNYNPAAKLQPYFLGFKSQFAWETGTIELPVGVQAGYLKRPYLTHFNFNIGPLMVGDEKVALKNSQAFLDGFYRQYGDDAIAVFVLHSWSFLRLDAGGVFSTVNTEAPGRLSALLSAWSEWADFVTPQDIVDLAKGGELALGAPVPIPPTALTEFNYDGPTPVMIDPPPVTPPMATYPMTKRARPAPPVGSPPTNLLVLSPSPAELPESALERNESMPAISTCPICETPISEFIDYNGPKRQCPGCNSTERQRALADLYVKFIKPEFDLGSKDLLVVAPAASEKRFLKSQNVKWKSIDIRPEVKADIRADLCKMPEVADGTFDAIMASFVLTCVHDLDACLSELRRILRPGGRMLTCDPLRFGGPTTEYTDIERITSWYGQENYDKYRIGSFRTFGDLDVIRTFQKHGFVVKTLYGYDLATDSRWVWHMSVKE